MGQALYRKYRPKTLKEVAGQEHITSTLDKALKKGQLSHAYLFTGPRGIGKTSVARIMAHEVNGLKYDDDRTDIDIIEIDAASNRRIDEIRELRDKVYVSPSKAKYKVYIIDEVHMLTREAFNALLKTLEEPPEHVIFILATTDAHKLPDTIVSRTQRYGFRPIPAEVMAKQLKDIAGKEKINASVDALDLIATHSQGSLRDGLSILDQARNYGDSITEGSIAELLGLPPEEQINDLANATLNGPSLEVTKILNDLQSQSYQPQAIAKSLGQVIRQQLLDDKLPISESVAIGLLKDLVEVPASHDPLRSLELALLSIVPADPAPEKVEPAQEIKQTEEPTKPATTESETKETKSTSKVRAKITMNEDNWSSVLEAVKKKHNTLYGVIRMAQPDFSEEGTLKLAFAFDFHRQRISESSNRKMLSDVIKDLTGQVIVIECVLDKSAQPPASASNEEPSEDLAAISNIFNGAEVLES
jgi:DNA polymerase-3 subunit gamma/tau